MTDGGKKWNWRAIVVARKTLGNWARLDVPQCPGLGGGQPVLCRGCCMYIRRGMRIHSSQCWTGFARGSHQEMETFHYKKIDIFMNWYRRKFNYNLLKEMICQPNEKTNNLLSNISEYKV